MNAELGKLIIFIFMLIVFVEINGLDSAEIDNPLKISALVLRKLELINSEADLLDIAIVVTREDYMEFRKQGPGWINKVPRDINYNFTPSPAVPKPSLKEDLDKSKPPAPSSVIGNKPSSNETADYGSPNVGGDTAASDRDVFSVSIGSLDKPVSKPEEPDLLAGKVATIGGLLGSIVGGKGKAIIGDVENKSLGIEPNSTEDDHEDWPDEELTSGSELEEQHLAEEGHNKEEKEEEMDGSYEDLSGYEIDIYDSSSWGNTENTVYATTPDTTRDGLVIKSAEEVTDEDVNKEIDFAPSSSPHKYLAIHPTNGRKMPTDLRTEHGGFAGFGDKEFQHHSKGFIETEVNALLSSEEEDFEDLDDDEGEDGYDGETTELPTVEPNDSETTGDPKPNREGESIISTGHFRKGSNYNIRAETVCAVESDCQPRPECLTPSELPFKHTTIYIPYCIRVMKCGGPCCSRTKSVVCQARKSSSKKYEIREYEHAGLRSDGIPVFVFIKEVSIGFHEDERCKCTPIDRSQPLRLHPRNNCD